MDMDVRAKDTDQLQAIDFCSGIAKEEKNITIYAEKQSCFFAVPGSSIEISVTGYNSEMICSTIFSPYPDSYKSIMGITADNKEQCSTEIDKYDTVAFYSNDRDSEFAKKGCETYK
jgi:hypothetical protein